MDDVILSAADIEQQYFNNIVLYKGEPVYVMSTGETDVHILNLETQKKNLVPFSLKTFSAYKGRLGMINIPDGSAAYVVRQPVRKMGIGINRYNINIRCIAADNAISVAAVGLKVKNLSDPCWYNLIKGKYPTFIEARDSVMESDTNKIVAFDRQFAISTSRCVYYKGEFVGSFTRACKSEHDIKFREGWEHLSIVIGDSYEKTVGLVCAE